MKIKVIFIIAFLFSIINHSFSQKQGNIWYFGSNGTGLDFNNCTVKVISGGKINPWEGCATIADSITGQLLFYTNSDYVWNRNHKIMPNGSIATSIPHHPYNSITQVLIIPKPLSNSKYYIFTSEVQASSNYPLGIRYHIVDMTQNGGLGDIISKNNKIYNSPVTEKLTAIKHANGVDIWVIGHEYGTNTFFSFLVSSTGVSTTPVLSNIGKIHIGANNSNWDAIGEIKASLNGSKLAVATFVNTNIELFDFDDSTGIISNLITLYEPGHYYTIINSQGLQLNHSYLYGISFSPNNKILYVTVGGRFLSSKLIQFDISSGIPAIINSTKQVICDTSGPNNEGLYSLKSAPNGNIYVARGAGRGINYGPKYLGVIQNPDSLGWKCNYVHDGIYLNVRNSTWGLNNLMEYPPLFYKSITLDLPNDTSLCDGDSLLLDATNNNATYLWQDSSTNPFYVVRTSGVYWVEVTLGGCTAIDTILVNYVPLPTINLGNDTTLCPRETLLINDTTSGASYLWQDSSTNPFYHVNTKGIYWVKVTLNGCDAFDTINIFHYDSPFVDFLINDSSQCLKGNNFSFTNKSSINSGQLLYKWDFGDGILSNNTNATHSYNSIGTHIVKLRAKSNHGCTDSIIKNVHVQVNPVANFFVNDTFLCPEETLLLDATTLGASFLWQDSSTNPSYNVTNSGLYWVEVILGECAASDSIQVHYKPSYSINLGRDTILCPGETVLLNDTSAGASYLWQDGSTDTFFNVITKGTYWVKITLNGCSAIDTIEVDHHPFPISDFVINDSSQCFETNKFSFINESSISPGQFIYQWDFGDGILSNNTDPDHSYNSIGTYPVKLTAVSDFGCKDSIVKIIYVYPNPVADFSVNDTIQCRKDNLFNFLNKSIVEYGSLNYIWRFGDGNESFSLNPTHIYNTSDTFYVKLIANSGGSCKDSLTRKLHVYPNPVAAFIYINSQCLEDTVYFYDRSIVDDPDFIKQWLWNFGNNNYSSQKNVAHIYNDSGRYKVILSTSTDFGCSDSATQLIKISGHVTESEIIRATVKDDEIVLIEWIKPRFGSIKNYSLERAIDGLFFNNLVDLDHKSLSYIDEIVKVDDQSYIYRINATDSCDYVSPYSNIGKTILLNIDAGLEHPVLSWTEYEEWPNRVDHYEVQIENEPATSFVTIAKVSDTTLVFKDSNSKLNQSHYCYRVVAFRKDSSEIVSVSNEVCIPTPFNIYVPNSFSPNGDGINDYFEIKGTFIIDFQISIYNRWGEQMFKSSDIEQSWDGFFKERICPQENYYYHIVAKGTKAQYKSVKGMVVLLR